MAEKKKYCRRCGHENEKDARFCRYCGTPFAEEAEEESKQKFCRYCGEALTPGAKFCRHCGSAVENAQADMSRKVETPPPAKAKKTPPSTKTAAKEEKKTAPKTGQKRPKADKGKVSPPPAAAAPMATAAAQAISIAASVRLAADKKAGEMALDEFDLSGSPIGTMEEKAEEALSPIRGILGALKAFLGGVLSLLKKPGNLLLALVMAALWTVLALLRHSDSPLVQTLSTMTFAHGGFDRSAAGTVGGILGMGTVAAAWGSLFTGGLGTLPKGVGRIVKGAGERRSILALLSGLLLGAALSYVFTGAVFGQTRDAVAGIAGAVLTLQAIGRREGSLYALAQGLTSRIQGSVRTAQNGRAQSLLTGLALGFGLCAALTALS